ncbi:MAG: S4 domain-containing protein [Eisenbergiella massiliensis]
MDDNTKQERLNKYLADCGICSRREADRMIEAGRVMVNGVPAETGMRITPADDVAVDGRILEKKDRKVVLAYYKPVGVTCTEKDKYARKPSVTPSITLSGDLRRTAGQGFGGAASFDKRRGSDQRTDAGGQLPRKGVPGPCE